MAEKIVNIADSVTVGELAETLGLSVTTLIGELFKMVLPRRLISGWILRLRRLLLRN